jgi:hypothetical protein
MSKNDLFLKKQLTSAKKGLCFVSLARQGMAGLGEARRGKVRQGGARLG